MGMSRVAWLAGAASLVAACAAVLDFPDRVLDSLDGGDDAPSGTDAPNDTGSDGAFEAGPPSATFSSSAVDFGMMPCGASSTASFTLKIQNTGGASLAWAATLSATTVFAIDGSPVGTIPPGGSA